MSIVHFSELPIFITSSLIGLSLREQWELMITGERNIGEKEINI